jgi:hypothetical protein
MQNVIVVRGTTRLSKFASHAMPLLALTLFLMSGIQGLAQVSSGAPAYVSPKVTPYVFNGDLSKLPPANPSSFHAPERKTIPGTFIEGPRPMIGPPDPLWHPGTIGGINAATLAPGVTPPQFTVGPDRLGCPVQWQPIQAGSSNPRGLTITKYTRTQAFRTTQAFPPRSAPDVALH